MSHHYVFEITGTVIGAVACIPNMIEIILLARKGNKKTNEDEIILSLSCAC